MKSIIIYQFARKTILSQQINNNHSNMMNKSLLSIIFMVILSTNVLSQVVILSAGDKKNLPMHPQHLGKRLCLNERGKKLRIRSIRTLFKRLSRQKQLFLYPECPGGSAVDVAVF